MMRHSSSREFREVARRMIARGWEIRVTGGGHLKWMAPSGAIVFSGSTPSDRRAAKNLRARLRRAEEQGAREEGTSDG